MLDVITWTDATRIAAVGIVAAWLWQDPAARLLDPVRLPAHRWLGQQRHPFWRWLNHGNTCGVCFGFWPSAVVYLDRYGLDRPPAVTAANVAAIIVVLIVWNLARGALSSVLEYLKPPAIEYRERGRTITMTTDET